MATDMPPPYVPPQAEEADPKLVTFLYYMMRDLIPAGYVETMMSRVTKPGETQTRFANPELGAYAERVAKTLVYDSRREVVHAVPPPGTIPASTSDPNEEST